VAVIGNQLDRVDAGPDRESAENVGFDEVEHVGVLAAGDGQMRDDVLELAAVGRASGQDGRMVVSYDWRGAFANHEVNALHAEAFETRVFGDSEWDWVELVHRHSLGWVVARDGRDLVGFVNVAWDGLVHAWLQDTMVSARARGRGIGTELVSCARRAAKAAGCEYLHVDFDDRLGAFYYGACGFRPTNGGLLSLD
jgi:GNAT superfamily N-acetyltransferase